MDPTAPARLVANESQSVPNNGSGRQPVAEGGEGILGFIARLVTQYSTPGTECGADKVYSDDCFANAHRGNH